MTGEPWFGILGPLTVGVAGGERTELGGRKQRELLAMRLIDVNQHISASRIADALWRGHPPASADVTLRTHVSHLRRRLATVGAQEALVTRQSRYGLFLGADQLDAARFEHLLGLGQEALGRGDPERAARLLEEALSLWRGPVLEDLGPPEFASTEAARLEELRLVALDHRIDADLSLGRHHAVIGELERLVAAHPFRERLHCQLMLALYRSGRQADALVVSASVRRRLVDELGVDPGPALYDLETAILRHDPALLIAGKEGPCDKAMPGLPLGALTKYRPPTPFRSLMPRARLLDMLRAGGRRRLVVIHGPAGFGKTTLAAQWREVLAEDGVTVAWLTIDSDDSNVVSFLAHLIEAVRGVRPSLAQDLRQTLEEHGDQAGRYVLTSLINDIEEGGTPIAVIIDDWHRISDAATIAVLTYLLDHGSQHLQVVVTSRTRAGLPMGRMRVRGELVEIDSAALRFDMSEARAFLVELGGLTLDDTDVARLEQTTDGWVAALQLAWLSLRDCEDPAALISRMSGRHHAVGEYLAENVLDSLEPEMLDFLMATSLTERVSGDLACALVGVANGQALLEEAAHRDLFLRRLDEEGEWFRYHHLFAEFLLRRLARDHPERITQLHATAARWFAEHNLLREAVDHVMAAGDEERAVELMDLYGIELTQQAQLGKLRALISKLPPHLVARSPRLQLTIAWANMLLQRPGDARAALEAVESATEKRALSPSELQDMRVETNVFRSVVECWADCTAGVDELVYECLSRPDSLPPFLVAVAANVASFLEIQRFDFDAARRWQDWANPYHQQSGSPASQVYGHSLAGVAANEQLEVAEAERCFREALQVAKRSGATHSHAAHEACAHLGQLLYERGEVDEAERLLDESYELGAAGGPVEFMITRHVIGARIKALRGDRDTAAGRLDEGARIAETGNLPRLRAHVDNERMRLDLPVADRTGQVERDDALPDGGLGEITAQLRDETAILGLLEVQPGVAYERAQACVQRLEQQGRPRALLQANRLLVAALDAVGRTDEAKQILTHIAGQCAELGMVRYLLDGGPGVVALLAELRDDLRSGRWGPTWREVPPAFLDTVASGSHSRSPGAAAQRGGS
jgi:serine/threonine-protein kinase PknK